MICASGKLVAHSPLASVIGAMSLLRQINKDSKSCRYLDESTCTEYLFVGFSKPISQTQKKKLIKKYVLRREYHPSLIDMEHAVFDFGQPVWQLQVIHRQGEQDE